MQAPAHRKLRPWRFFVLTGAARNRMGEWCRAGLVKSRFDIVRGIEQMPSAFLRLLKSLNVGKQLVQVADEPA